MTSEKYAAMAAQVPDGPLPFLGVRPRPLGVARLARVLVTAVALVAATGLAFRLMLSYQAGGALAQAAERCRQARLVVPTVAVESATSGRDSVGTAWGRYGAAILLTPSWGAINFPWLPSGKACAENDVPLPVPVSQEKALADCLAAYEQAIDLVVAGAALDYRLAIDENRLPLIDGRRPDDNRRVIAGTWSLLSLLRARAVLAAQKGQGDRALSSCCAALRFLDFGAGRSGVEGEAARQRAVIDFSNTVAYVLRASNPSPQALERAREMVGRVRIWPPMVRALQSTVHNDVSRVYEARPQAASPYDWLVRWTNRPWRVVDEARYLDHMAAFAEFLAGARLRCLACKAWGRETDEAAGAFYVNQYYRNAVKAKMALDLTLLRVEERLGDGFSPRPEDGEPHPSRRFDPYSGERYRRVEQKGRALFYGVGPNGKDDGGSLTLDVVYPTSD